MPNVTKAARRTGDIALIVGPVVGGMLFIAVVGLVVFLFMARKGGAQFSAVVRFLDRLKLAMDFKTNDQITSRFLILCYCSVAYPI